MKLTKYDSYKGSGVKWLGEIPSQWTAKRVKDIIVKIGSGVTPTGGSEIYPITGIPFLRSQNVYDEGLEFDGVVFITEEINKKMKSSQIKPNDILLNITGASIGRTCIVPDSLKKANINQHIAFIRLKNKANIDFFSLYLKSHFLKEYISSQQNGASKEAFNLAQIAVIPILDFENNYSRLIFNFLDKKTSQVERKIQLLQEKKENYEELKKSLINETVCRGLIKDVELKDSGIEWIGKIPKQWHIERNKNLFIESKELSNTGKEDLLSVSEYTGVSIRSKDVKTGNNSSRADSLINYKICKKGDLVMNIMLAWKTGLGVSPFFGIVSPAYSVYRPKNSIFSKYYHYLFRTKLYTAEFRRNSTGIINSRLRLYSDKFFAIHVVVPPKREQIQIANYLDNKTSKIDKIISKINAQIETLKEFRKTLINNVVTGKVKIQNE
jgi:type I restriction enzyme S subunit